MMLIIAAVFVLALVYCLGITYPLSAKNGTATNGGVALAEVKDIKVSLKANNPSFDTNTVPGWKRRVFGVRDAEVTFEMLSDPEAAGMGVGATYNLVILADGTTTYHTMPVMTDSIDVAISMDSGDPVAFTLKCSQNGQVT